MVRATFWKLGNVRTVRCSSRQLRRDEYMGMLSFGTQASCLTTTRSRQSSGATAWKIRKLTTSSPNGVWS